MLVKVLFKVENVQQISLSDFPSNTILLLINKDAFDICSEYTTVINSLRVFFRTSFGELFSFHQIRKKMKTTTKIKGIQGA